MLSPKLKHYRKDYCSMNRPALHGESSHRLPVIECPRYASCQGISPLVRARSGTVGLVSSSEVCGPPHSITLIALVE